VNAPSALLGDVSETIMGQAPPGADCNKNGNGTIFVKAGEFSDVEPVVREWTTNPQKLAKKGDILVCVVGATAGKINLGIDCAIGRSVAAVRPSSKHLDTNYLHYFLRTRTGRLRAISQGLAQGVITRDMLAKLEIPLPPLDEQRRIAAILDKADALRRKRKCAIELLDGLTQSIFLEMFGGREDSIEALKDVVRTGTIVTYGIVQAGPEHPGGIPYIRTGDLVNGSINIDNLRHTDPTIAARFARSQVEADDIVMSIRATVGTTAVVPAALAGANLTQGTARISPGEKVTVDYLIEYLRSDVIQRWIAAQVKGATFLEITLGRLRELPVAVPPLTLQKQFSKLVAKVRATRELATDHFYKSDLTFSSLQHRAFSGQL
jgi:type I restriction enzyme S subunit